MRIRARLFTSLAFFLLATFLPGDELAAGGLRGTVFIGDSFRDHVLAFQDRDGSGSLEPETDGTTVYYSDSSDGPDLSSLSHLYADQSGDLFVLDGGTHDSVFIFHDRSGDGDADDEGEWGTFLDDSSEVRTLATPNSLVRLVDGSFLVADDGSGARFLVRLTDLNGDRDALDPGEAAIVFDAANASGVTLEDPEAICETPDGLICVGDSTLGVVLKLEDLDGNGDFQGPNEAAVYSASTAKVPFTRVSALQAGPTGALYLGDRDTGRVLRIEDLDGDGDALDAGEVSVFLGESTAIRIGELNDMIRLPDGSFLLLDGGADTVFALEDLNGDGDADDDGEVRRWLLGADDLISTPSAIAYCCDDSEPPPRGTFVRGDVDANGSLGLADAIRVLLYLFLGESIEVCPDALDADDDGVLSVSDPIYVLNYLFIGGPPPPAPFPEEGTDPTPDDLECSPDF